MFPLSKILFFLCFLSRIWFVEAHHVIPLDVIKIKDNLLLIRADLRGLGLRYSCNFVQVRAVGGMWGDEMSMDLPKFLINILPLGHLQGFGEKIRELLIARAVGGL